MTTLVTGAAGFLGSHVARQLVARGDDVRVLLRVSSSNRAISDLSLEYVTGDLRDASSLERAMAEAFAGYLRFQCGRNQELACGGKEGRCRTADLHEYGSDHCSRSTRVPE